MSPGFTTSPMPVLASAGLSPTDHSGPSRGITTNNRMAMGMLCSTSEEARSKGSRAGMSRLALMATSAAVNRMATPST